MKSPAVPASPKVTYWLAAGVLAQLLAAPNASIIKVVLESVSPTTYNTLRAAICFAVALPFVAVHWRKLTRRNVILSLVAGVCTTGSVTLISYAIVLSQASYVVILTLLSPIMLVVFSSFIFHEKVRFRAVAGITLAAVGAFTAVAIPLAIGNGTTLEVYPLATILIVLATILVPLAVILQRKANEAGLPLTSTQGISAAVVMTISFTASFALNGKPIDLAAVPAGVWLGTAYTAIFVVFIARLLTIASYERIGAAATGGLTYLGTIVALIIPVVLLHERLSVASIIGGILILCGVFLTEQYHARHLHRHHFFWHH